MRNPSVAGTGFCMAFFRGNPVSIGFFQFLVTVFDNLLTGDDPDEKSLVIYNRNIILVNVREMTGVIIM